MLDAAADLVVVGRAGIGIDNVDVAAATKRGVMVVNAPQSNILSAAEHTIALLLAQALADGRVPEKVRPQVLTAAMARPEMQIRDLFERFIPDDQRIKRLGSVIKPMVTVVANALRVGSWIVDQAKRGTELERA